jgi:integrase
MRDITPINNNGSIQLKFAVSGKRYAFNPIPGGHYSNKVDLATARAIAVQIQNDIRAGHFDPSLDRYRLVPKVAAKTQPKTLLALFDLWVASLDLSPGTYAGHHRWLRQMIEQADPALEDTQWLTSATLAHATMHERLRYMRSCFNWAMVQGYAQANPYALLKPAQKPLKPQVKPFTHAEIEAILGAIHPHYKPFTAFLFLTGCRISEAIGLTWQHVDFDRGTITIAESLSVDRAGNGYRRHRKGTKTGSVTILPMSEALRTLLSSITKGSPDSLVFTSIRGKTIDNDTYRKDYWQPALERAKVPYRYPRNNRHTLASHAISQGLPLTDIAYLLGHRDTQMVMRTYGRTLGLPELPDLGL